MNKGSAKDPLLMRLLWALSLFCASYNITLTAHHIAGIKNSAADALSRNDLGLFLSLTPQAHCQREQLLSTLLELAFNHSLLWTSPDWIRLFAAILRSASSRQPNQPTSQLSAGTQDSAF